MAWKMFWKITDEEIKTVNVHWFTARPSFMEHPKVSSVCSEPHGPLILHAACVTLNYIATVYYGHFL